MRKSILTTISIRIQESMKYLKVLQNYTSYMLKSRMRLMAKKLSLKMIVRSLIPVQTQIILKSSLLLSLFNPRFSKGSMRKRLIKRKKLYLCRKLSVNSLTICLRISNLTKDLSKWMIKTKKKFKMLSQKRSISLKKRKFKQLNQLLFKQLQRILNKQQRNMKKS